MDLEFTGDILYRKGPSPHPFVSVPEDQCEELRAVASEVSYGWGMIPVAARLGATEWTTSLFPKDGGYLVPIKDKVRALEEVEIGDPVAIRLTIDA